MEPKEIRGAVRALQRRTRHARVDARPACLERSWHDFFDLAEDPRFIEDSKRSTTTMVDTSLRALSGSTPRGRRLQHLVQLQHVDTGLIHGAALVEGRITTYFWFPTDRAGMAAIHCDDCSITYAVISAPQLAAGRSRRPRPQQRCDVLKAGSLQARR